MKKKLKKAGQDAMALAGTGIIIGAGSSAVTAAGGSAAGLSTFSGYMPVMGNVMGAGYTLGMLNDLQPKRRRK